MTNQKFIEECLKRKGAYIDFPFGSEFAVIKVKNKIFAQAFALKGVETITLNCTREGGYYYRNKYPNIVTRGWHCPPVQQPYFNSLPTLSQPDESIIEMINHSYETVVAKLPKHIQAQLEREL